MSKWCKLLSDNSVTLAELHHPLARSMPVSFPVTVHAIWRSEGNARKTMTCRCRPSPCRTRGSPVPYNKLPGKQVTGMSFPPQSRESKAYSFLLALCYGRQHILLITVIDTDDDAATWFPMDKSF